MSGKWACELVSSNRLTSPAIVVLFANISSLLEKEPGTIEVAKRDSQMERCPTSGVHTLQIHLQEKKKAEWKGWEKESWTLKLRAAMQYQHLYTWM